MKTFLERKNKIDVKIAMHAGWDNNLSGSKQCTSRRLAHGDIFEKNAIQNVFFFILLYIKFIFVPLCGDAIMRKCLEHNC